PWRLVLKVRSPEGKCFRLCVYADAAGHKQSVVSIQRTAKELAANHAKKGAYPAILVKTSFNDSQVMYWEPAKYVARLRTLKTDKNVLLLKTNMAAGHGGSSGRYDHLKEIAFDYAFMLTQLGVSN
ncbi:MAG TPA: prolyl oligopeptidase family serine peptidase, partial [Candidatus Binatia bacterium]|nr:prolyl oligopeptidase family serine peptidase [Candidatus Binatia bacterium]